MMSAAHRLCATLQSCMRADTSLATDNVSVDVRGLVFTVPACVVNVTFALVSRHRFCGLEVWDELVEDLRNNCLWPPLTLYTYDATANCDWVGITAVSVLEDRLERSMHGLHCICRELVEPSEYGVTLAQALFGFNMDRNPSIKMARRLLGDELTEQEYVFIHFAIMAAFMLDAAPMNWTRARVDPAHGRFLVDFRPAGRLQDFEY